MWTPLRERPKKEDYITQKNKIMKLKVGDTVASKAHPEIKSKIKEIKPSKYLNEMMYFCSNGCIYTRDEIIKI